MKKLVLISTMCIAIAGCGSDTDKVKNGILEFNKTITVGQALDNWKSCESKSWEEFSAENGVKIVQFTCNHKIKEYIEKVKVSVPEEINNGAIYLDIASYIEKFQFTINNDDTFQIHNVSAETQWSDGEKVDGQQKPMEELEMAYSNKLSFDPEELNYLGSGQFAFAMKFVKPGEKYKEKIEENTKILIEKIESLNDLCRGGSGDDPKTEKACEEIDSVMKKLESSGWCWGPDSAIEADKKWIKCK